MPIVFDSSSPPLEDNYFFEFPLSNFQRFAIQGIKEGHHSLCCVPTGSGKTVPALYAIDFFTKQGKRVIYTSPIKALSNQKYKEFGDAFPDVSFGILTGDVKINLEADVLIMTAEILQYKLGQTTDLDINFETVGCIIHDEIHMINDSDRGHVWENCLTMCPNHIQMVLLSATLKDPIYFANWIESIHPTRKVFLSSTNDRPVPLVQHAYYLVPKYVRRMLEKTPDVKEEVESLEDKMLPLQSSKGIFLRDKYYEMKRIRTLQHKYQCRIQPVSIIEAAVKRLIAEDMLPAVCFVYSKGFLEKIAKSIQVDMGSTEESQSHKIEKECVAILRGKFSNFKEFMLLPEFEFLMTLFRRGIAIHHSSMTPVLRELVEILFERGFIKLLFATETFSVGLNMPIRTTMFTDIFKYDGYRSRMLYPHEFVQASGRAGRRGMDTKGNVVHLLNLYSRYDDVQFFDMIKGNPPELRSKFKFSWDLVLKNDRQFFSRLLYSEELSQNTKKEKTTLENLESNLGIWYRQNLESVKTPKEIREEYVHLQRKKSKKKHGQQRLLIEQYPHLLNDLLLENTFSEKCLQVEHQKNLYREMTMVMEENIQKARFFLQEDGCLRHDGSITQKGEFCLFIKEVPALVLLSVWKNMETLVSTDLVCFLSCFATIRVPEDKRIVRSQLRVSHELSVTMKECEERIEYLQRYESDHNLWTGESYDFQFELVPYIKGWMDAQNEMECLQILYALQKEKAIMGGDFTKAMLKICNIALQMEHVAASLSQVGFLKQIKEIPKRLQKFMVTNQSLYL